MKKVYDILLKKYRRYAAVEVHMLSHGGIDYSASVLGCDSKVENHSPVPYDVGQLSRDESEA